MKNKKLLSTLTVVLTIGMLSAFALSSKPIESVAEDECSFHEGFHYSEKEATFDESGHKEFWSCCICHHSYIDEAPNGNFVDHEESLMDGAITEEHIAYIPPLQRVLGMVTYDTLYGMSYKQRRASVNVLEGSIKKGDSLYLYLNQTESLKIQIDSVLSDTTVVDYIDVETSFPSIVFSNSCPLLSTLSNTVYFTNFLDSNSTNDILCRYCYRDYSQNIGKIAEGIENFDAYFSNDIYDENSELAFKVDLLSERGFEYSDADYCILCFASEFYYPTYLLEQYRYLFVDGVCVYLLPDGEIRGFNYVPEISSKTNGCFVREHYFDVSNGVGEFSRTKYKTLDFKTPYETEPYYNSKIAFLQDADDVQKLEADLDNECIIKSNFIYLAGLKTYSNDADDQSILNNKVIVLDELGNKIGESTITNCNFDGDIYNTTIGPIFDGKGQRLYSYSNIGAIYIEK